VYRLSPTSLLRTAAVAVALGMPASAAAQAKFELVPYFGSFYALTNFLDEDVALVGGGTVHVVQKHSSAPSIGGKLRYWLSPMWGLEGAVNYAWTGIQTSFPDEPSAVGQGKLDGTMLTATGRIVYRPRRSNVYLLAGGGYMKVSGDAWNDDVNDDGIKDFDVTTSNFTGVVGVGVRAQVAPKFAIDVGVESNLYSVDRIDPAAGNTSPDIYDKEFLANIIVTVGVPIGF
jgi:opacity protein-like surface antigen